MKRTVAFLYEGPPLHHELYSAGLFINQVLMSLLFLFLVFSVYTDSVRSVSSLLYGVGKYGGIDNINIKYMYNVQCT